MAKLENSQSKKLKGKKRKHNSTGTEDEVANKSVIVEPDTQSNEQMEINTETEQVNSKKSKKRKNKEKGDIQEKRSKTASDGGNFNPIDDDHEADDDYHHEPSREELLESEKPENNFAIVTGRQKKKHKHQKCLEAQKGQSAEKDKERNAEYLKKWKHMRTCWKFEKLRQISIQQTMFDNDKLDADVWPIALEYLAGSKGAAKDIIVKLAKDVIDGIDQQETDEEIQFNVNSVKYQRARDLLQTLY